MADEKILNDINEEDYEPELLTLTDDDGKEYTFEILDEIEENGQFYIALVPSFDTPEDILNTDGELVILREVFEGDEVFYDDITNEKELEKISSIFVSRLQDYYEIVE